MMRIVFKVLLFPVTLALSIAVAICRFVCGFSGALLSVASGIVFTIAFLGLVPPLAKLPTLTLLNFSKTTALLALSGGL